MRLAILSDIHGNIEAFKEVLRDVTAQNVQGCYFLGDAISYGPEPDRVLRLLQRLNIPCVLGNHELALIHSYARNYFNFTTRHHFAQAEKLISLKSKKFISTWPAWRKEQGMILVHGCPPDSATRYLFELDQEQLFRVFSAMDFPVAFVGHTHELEIIEQFDHGIMHKKLTQGIHLVQGDKALINVGSVGQPRDGDNRAKYIIWEPEKKSIEVCFVDYDILKSAAGILNRGFSKIYAQRLW